MTLIIITIFFISFVTFGLLILKQNYKGTYKYTVTEQFNVTCEQLWNTITDYEAQPMWRKGLVKAEKVVTSKSRDIWRETDIKGQYIEWESFAQIRGRKLIRKTINQNMPMISTHTYELKPYGEISLLTVTEVTEVNNFIFRLIKYSFSSTTSELVQFIKDLKAKINNDIVNRTNIV